MLENGGRSLDRHFTERRVDPGSHRRLAHPGRRDRSPERPGSQWRDRRPDERQDGLRNHHRRTPPVGVRTRCWASRVAGVGLLLDAVLSHRRLAGRQAEIMGLRAELADLRQQRRARRAAARRSPHRSDHRARQPAAPAGGATAGRDLLRRIGPVGRPGGPRPPRQRADKPSTGRRRKGRNRLIVAWSQGRAGRCVLLACVRTSVGSATGLNRVPTVSGMPPPGPSAIELRVKKPLWMVAPAELRSEGPVTAAHPADMPLGFACTQPRRLAGVTRTDRTTLVDDRLARIPAWSPCRTARSLVLAPWPEGVKPSETRSLQLLWMRASLLGWLIHAAAGSFGGSGRRWRNRRGFAL